jgi:hypothetical protein
VVDSSSMFWEMKQFEMLMLFIRFDRAVGCTCRVGVDCINTPWLAQHCRSLAFM